MKTTINYIWPFFIALAVVETIVYHTNLVGLPYIVEKYSVISYDCLWKLLTDKSYLKWAKNRGPQLIFDRFDAGIVFLSLFLIAIKAVSFPYSGTSRISFKIRKILWDLCLSVVISHFFNRFVFLNQETSLLNLLLPTLVGVSLPLIGYFLSKFLGWEKTIYIMLWIVIFGILLRFFCIARLYVQGDIAGTFKDFACITIIFVLSVIVYSKIEEIKEIAKQSPTFILLLIIGIVGVALFALYLDLKFPYADGGKALCTQILKLENISVEQNLSHLQYLMETHALIRSGVLLFLGVVAPFVLSLLYYAFSQKTS